MEQTLKQKIIPELDERQIRRESEKISSFVEDSLKDIAPLDTDSGLFSLEDMLEDMENMQDMTEDISQNDMFSGVNFSQGDFAEDVMFGEGAAQMGQEVQESINEEGGSILDPVSDIVQEGAGKRQGRRRPGDKIFDGLEKVGSKLDDQTGLLGGLSGLFIGGAAAVAVGGFALSLLESIFSSVKKFASASPLLGTAVDMIGFAMEMFLRPIARTIGTWLLPLAISMVELSTGFNRVWSEGGMFDAIRFLVDELTSMVLTMELTQMRNLAALVGGLFLLRQIGARAILSRLFPTQLASQLIARLGIGGLGSRILGRMGLGGLGGRIVTRLGGSLVPGLNAILWGDLLFDLIFGFSPIFDWLLPNVIEAFQGFVNWLTRLPDRIMESIDGLVTGGEFSRILEGIIPGFDIWERVWNSWDGWPSELFTFTVWDMVEGAWNGWPSSVFSFNVWTTVLNMFDGWPDLSFPGWGTFIDSIDWNLTSFDWGDFIPTIDFNLPDFPGWGDVISGTADAVGRVRERFESSGDGADPSTDQTLGESIMDGTDFDSPVTTSFGFASGGIATGPVSAVIGEGRESEVVAPLSRLDSMIQSRAGTNIDMTVGDAAGQGLTEREMAEAVRSGIESSDMGDNGDVESLLKRVVREINRMRSDMDLQVEFTDQSKWEIKE